MKKIRKTDEKKKKREKKSEIWIRSARKKVERINALAPTYKTMSDKSLRSITAVLKGRLEKGEKLASILPDAFAAVREAAKRVTGMRPYDVQVLGGIALSQGCVAELKTGEGKTLLAVLPAYLHALEGKGVHVVTVNDYLAARDAKNMGPIYEFMGMTVGTVISSTSAADRKRAYACDVTYVTNTELGFDYLRDNMARTAGAVVQRGLNYAIIDEADSILIDEARTPLIISGEGTDMSALYRSCDVLAKGMTRGHESKEFNRIDAFLDDAPVETGDFIVHEKDKNVTLTENGVKKVEQAFGIKRFADPQNVEIQHTMSLALRANYIMKKDKDYIVRNGEILIVDEFTGRIMEGRQYSDGLHQAIEAKEGVQIREESQTIASTTYQSLFPKYKLFAGMTGTAYTEKKEFRHTYGLRVVVIPTNRPMIRIDHPDRVFVTKKGKLRAILEDVKQTHEKGQPILLGTASVTASEAVSDMLKKEGIPHTVLNARQDAHEAEIIAGAGKYGAVTVATNMAGRGTDIVLDEKAVAAGGLKVIGTEKHESRRIDNQLRGRSGRQGDPGESVFYISAEDDMMRLYGSDSFRNVLKKGGFDDYEEIKSRMFIRSIHKAQEKVEDNNFGIRKSVLDFDRVNDRQRELIYGERRKLLNGNNVTREVGICLERAVENLVDSFAGGKKKDCDLAGLAAAYSEMTRQTITADQLTGSNRELKKKLLDDIDVRCSDLEFSSTSSRESHERSCLLSAIDSAWMEQIRALEFLRQGIFYLSYAQLDPKSMYSVEAFRLYSDMKKNIYYLTAYLYFNNVPAKKKKLEMTDGQTITISPRKDASKCQ